MNKENNKYLKNVQDVNLHTEKEKIQGKPNAYNNIFTEESKNPSENKNK